MCSGSHAPVTWSPSPFHLLLLILPPYFMDGNTRLDILLYIYIYFFLFFVFFLSKMDIALLAFDVTLAPSSTGVYLWYRYAYNVLLWWSHQTWILSMTNSALLKTMSIIPELANGTHTGLIQLIQLIYFRSSMWQERRSEVSLLFFFLLFNLILPVHYIDWLGIDGCTVKHYGEQVAWKSRRGVFHWGVISILDRSS